MAPLTGIRTGNLGRGAGVTVSIDFIPDPDVIAKYFGYIASQVENMRPPLLMSRAVYIEALQENFHGKMGWPPHSDATIRIHGPHPLNILSGDMYGAIPAAVQIGANTVFFNAGELPSYWVYTHDGHVNSGWFWASGYARKEIETWAETLPDEARAKIEFKSGRVPERPFIVIDMATENKVLAVWDHWWDSVTGGGMYAGTLVGATGRGQPIFRGPSGRPRFGSPTEVGVEA